MIIKETPWEKRNLEVESSVEFYISQDEAWKEIEHNIITHIESYQVMHIAGGNTDVLLNVNKEGFIPIETNIRLSKKLDNNINLPTMYKRFEPYISCSIANEEERKIIFDSIREGGMFSTDKVARDPFFGYKYAGKRYAYWTQDVLENGAVLLSMKYKGKMAAFDVCIDKTEGVAEAFLGGVFPEFQRSGLGFLAVYFITKYAKEKGFRKIVTGVSSNNLSILKIHEIFGYSIDGISYCLIKHM